MDKNKLNKLIAKYIFNKDISKYEPLVLATISENTVIRDLSIYCDLYTKVEIACTDCRGKPFSYSIGVSQEDLPEPVPDYLNPEGMMEILDEIHRAPKDTQIRKESILAVWRVCVEGYCGGYFEGLHKDLPTAVALAALRYKGVELDGQ